ncbi:unnamed protein product [Arctia plantaginis]|uniref:Methyltransferase type 11 domain-containing protein n=1 Tax=Arctia plantaginis TaxID=874455 RepID=A0A8S1B698_ARCPL|nr:unnamed protein product [Arctia plantaginis]
MNKPELYRLSNSMQRKDAAEFLEEYAPKMTWKKNNNRILDVGCGDGSVTNMLMKYLPNDFNLLGSDINENMVKFANEQNRNTQTSFIVSDMVDEIPEEMKRSFDHVFSFYALHWVENQKQVFKNIFDLLEENGQFFAIFVGSNPYQQIFRTMSQDRVFSPFAQEVEKQISPYCDSKEPEKEITNLMESSGFIDVDVKCEDKIFQSDDMHLFKKHFIAVLPFKLPDEILEYAFENFIRMLKEIEIAHGVNNPPNIVNIYYKLFKVYGHKPLV